MGLYEIGNQYMDFFEQVESGEIPEDAISDTLEAMDGELAEKLDNVACYIKDLNAMAAAQDDESKALKEKSTANKNHANRMKNLLIACMIKAHKKKIETPRNQISIRSGSKKVEVDSENFVKWATESGRDDLLRYKDPEPSLSAIGDAIKAEEDIKFAAIVRGQDTVVIK